MTKKTQPKQKGYMAQIKDLAKARANNGTEPKLKADKFMEEALRRRK